MRNCTTASPPSRSRKRRWLGRNEKNVCKITHGRSSRQRVAVDKRFQPSCTPPTPLKSRPKPHRHQRNQLPAAVPGMEQAGGHSRLVKQTGSGKVGRNHGGESLHKTALGARGDPPLKRQVAVSYSSALSQGRRVNCLARGDLRDKHPPQSPWPTCRQKIKSFLLQR